LSKFEYFLKGPTGPYTATSYRSKHMVHLSSFKKFFFSIAPDQCPFK
jgi:hypothetical protein